MPGGISHQPDGSDEAAVDGKKHRALHHFEVTLMEMESVFTTTKLGSLERVDLRTVWTSEATHFTSWLAQEENLRLLGETVGLDWLGSPLNLKYFTYFLLS